MSTSEATHSIEISRGFFPKLGSVLALAPLGVWVTWHLWENFYALMGREAWESRVTDGNGMVEAVTLGAVFIPLIIHTIWGLRRLTLAKPNGYSYFGNLKYVLQRVSALGVMAFIIAHVYLARIRPLLGNTHEHFEDLANEMRTGPTLTVYLLGTLGTAFHLANGLYTASFIHGVAASKKASRRMQVISVLFFLLLMTFSWGAVYGLWHAGDASAIVE